MKITKSQLKQIIKEEFEEVDLTQLDPTVDKIVASMELEIERLPESSREVVRQAIVAKLGALADPLKEISSEKLEEDG